MGGGYHRFARAGSFFITLHSIRTWPFMGMGASRNAWVQKIENSYLTTPAKAGYLEILNDRRSRLFG